MKKILTIAAMLALMAVFVTGCGCKHDWNAESCGFVTCNLCGKESDVVREHVWYDADCVTPQTCNNCDATQGLALGHSWVEANCTTAKTCAVCGLAEGEPLGHGQTQWVFSTDLGMMGTVEIGHCPVCNESMGERNCYLDTFLRDGLLFFSPSQFERYHDGYYDSDDAVSTELVDDPEGGMMLSCMEGENLVYAVYFYREDRKMTLDQKDEGGIDKLEFHIPYSTGAGERMIALMNCCDPKNWDAENDENVSAVSKELYRELMDGYNSTKERTFTAERNGVRYRFAPYQEDGQIWYYIEVTPAA